MATSNKKFFGLDKVQEVFSVENRSYGSFSKLMFDTAKNTFEVGITKDIANNKIREIMFEVIGLPVDASNREIKKALKSTSVREAVFAVIEETIEDLLVSGWGDNPFFNQFVEMKSVADGDTNEFYTKDNVILTVSELAGNHHNLFRQRLNEGKTFSVKTSWYGVKIYAEYELFMSGRVDWANFIQKVYEAYDKKVNDMIYSALTSVGTSLPAGGQWVKTAPLSTSTKDTFDTLLEDVQTANGTEVTIMGTRSALSKLTNLDSINWLSEDMKQERHTTGRLGVYEGVTLFEIPQSFANNDTTTKLIDNTKLYIMPLADNKFIKMFNEGDTQIKEVSDGTTNADKTIEYEFQAKMGVATVINRLFGIWNITSNISA